MSRRPDTADKILTLRAELRKHYRTRDTVAGPVREIESAPPGRGENRKSTVRKLKKLNAHIAERQWFYRLTTIATKQYLATHRIDPRIAVMASWCKAAHEAKYPGWAVTDPPRLPESMSAQGVGSMILRAVQSGKSYVLPPGALVDRLNASMLKHPINEQERAIVKAARGRVRAQLGRRAHAAALEKGTTTKRSANRKLRALALLKSKTQKQVAEQLGLDVRTIRRYQRER